ncbi:MAG TPA: hypothetical protein VF988_04990, partial [Verrucomicrobiae bacterium]
LFIFLGTAVRLQVKRIGVSGTFRKQRCRWDHSALAYFLTRQRNRNSEEFLHGFDSAMQKKG